MIINYCFNLITLLICFIYLKKFLHIYQLKDYSNLRYLNYFANKKNLIYLFYYLIFIFQILINNLIVNCIINTINIIIFIIYSNFLIKQNKTKLKYTPKLKRIYYICIFLLSLFGLFLHFHSLIFIFTMLSPIIANFINLYDKIKNSIFIKKAKNKLHNSKTKIIAITGSNGKTSVKNILQQMLQTQYNTQATPSSFNTPLGIAKFINNDLQFNCEFLILEYGARHKKDIKKLCSIYGANYGIITHIAPQHLQTFKHIENVYLAKKELSNYLQNNFCVYNTDNIYCKRMFKEKTGNNLSCSIHEQANIYANNIKIENYKTSFDLYINEIKFHLSTNLLGRHNVLNICLATAMSVELGITHENITKTIVNLNQVEHRLYLIKTHINILDDSYNCSPASSKEAINTLCCFPNKKMVVTPGIIEGGRNEYLINYELGINLSVVDYVVIVGNHNKKAILEGLKSQNFNDNNIFIAATLTDAKQYFKLLNNNDNLLLLNDLPDDYN